MNRLTLVDFSRLSGADLFTTVDLRHNSDCVCDRPHPRNCVIRHTRDEVVSLSMNELWARSAGLKPHRTVSRPQDGAS